MEFKKIQLNGFKSFAEKTDFLIENSTISLDRMPLGDEGSAFVIFDRKEVKKHFYFLYFFKFLFLGSF